MTRDDLVRELERAEQHVLDVRRRISDLDRFERLRSSDSLTARVLIYMEQVGSPLTSIKSLRLYGKVERVGYGRYALRNVE